MGAEGKPDGTDTRGASEGPTSESWKGLKAMTKGPFWLGVYLIVAFAIILHLASVLWPSPLANQQARDTLDHEAMRLDLIARVQADSAKELEAAVSKAADTTAARRVAVMRRQKADSAQKYAIAARQYSDSVNASAVRAGLNDSEVTFLFIFTRNISLDLRLILLALVLGALGSFVHAAQSLATYVGNQQFNPAWGWWYVLRPFIGAALAAMVYFAVRGSLFPSALSVSGEVNPFGIAALATLAGMFSKQATDKLDEVFTTLFRTGPRVGDAVRADKLVPDTAPVILKVAPNPVKPNADAQVTFVITGTALAATTKVKLAGKDMTTSLNGDGTLTAFIAMSALPGAGTHKLTVTNLKGDTTSLTSQPFDVEVTA